VAFFFQSTIHLLMFSRLSIPDLLREGPEFEPPISHEENKAVRSPGRLFSFQSTIHLLMFSRLSIPDLLREGPEFEPPISHEENKAVRTPGRLFSFWVPVVNQ